MVQTSTSFNTGSFAPNSGTDPSAEAARKKAAEEAARQAAAAAARQEAAKAAQAQAAQAKNSNPTTSTTTPNNSVSGTNSANQNWTGNSKAEMASTSSTPSSLKQAEEKLAQLSAKDGSVTRIDDKQKSIEEKQEEISKLKKEKSEMLPYSDEVRGVSGIGSRRSAAESAELEKINKTIERKEIATKNLAREVKQEQTNLLKRFNQRVELANRINNAEELADDQANSQKALNGETVKRTEKFQSPLSTAKASPDLSPEQAAYNGKKLLDQEIDRRKKAAAENVRDRALYLGESITNTKLKAESKEGLLEHSAALASNHEREARDIARLQATQEAMVQALDSGDFEKATKLVNGEEAVDVKLSYNDPQLLETVLAKPNLESKKEASEKLEQLQAEAQNKIEQSYKLSQRYYKNSAESHTEAGQTRTGNGIKQFVSEPHAARSENQAETEETSAGNISKNTLTLAEALKESKNTNLDVRERKQELENALQIHNRNVTDSKQAVNKARSAEKLDQELAAIDARYHAVRDTGVAVGAAILTGGASVGVQLTVGSAAKAVLIGTAGAVGLAAVGDTAGRMINGENLGEAVKGASGELLRDTENAFTSSLSTVLGMGASNKVTGLLSSEASAAAQTLAPAAAAGLASSLPSTIKQSGQMVMARNELIANMQKQGDSQTAIDKALAKNKLDWGSISTNTGVNLVQGTVSGVIGAMGSSGAGNAIPKAVVTETSQLAVAAAATTAQGHAIGSEEYKLAMMGNLASIAPTRVAGYYQQKSLAAMQQRKIAEQAEVQTATPHVRDEASEQRIGPESSASASTRGKELEAARRANDETRLRQEIAGRGVSSERGEVNFVSNLPEGISAQLEIIPDRSSPDGAKFVTRVKKGEEGNDFVIKQGDALVRVLGERGPRLSILDNPTSSLHNDNQYIAERAVTRALVEADVQVSRAPLEQQTQIRRVAATAKKELEYLQNKQDQIRQGENIDAPTENDFQKVTDLLVASGLVKEDSIRVYRNDLDTHKENVKNSVGSYSLNENYYSQPMTKEELFRVQAIGEAIKETDRLRVQIVDRPNDRPAKTSVKELDNGQRGALIELDPSLINTLNDTSLSPKDKAHALKTLQEEALHAQEKLVQIKTNPANVNSHETLRGNEPRRREHYTWDRVVAEMKVEQEAERRVATLLKTKPETLFDKHGQREEFLKANSKGERHTQDALIQDAINSGLITEADMQNYAKDYKAQSDGEKIQRSYSSTATHYSDDVFSQPIDSLLRLPEAERPQTPYNTQAKMSLFGSRPHCNMETDLKHPTGTMVRRADAPFTTKSLTATGTQLKINDKDVPIYYVTDDNAPRVDLRIIGAFRVVQNGFSANGKNLEHGFQRHGSWDPSSLEKSGDFVKTGKFAREIDALEYLAEVQHGLQNPVAIVVNPYKENIEVYGLTTNPQDLGAKYINIVFNPEKGFVTAYPTGEGSRPELVMSKRNSDGEIIFRPNTMRPVTIESKSGLKLGESLAPILVDTKTGEAWMKDQSRISGTPNRYSTARSMENAL